MFLKMFKTSDRISVKKIEQPAALTLDRGLKPHPFNGLFKQSVQKDYRGRQAFIPAIDKTLEPEASAPKAVKAKTKPKAKSGLDPKVLAAIDELLINADRLRDATAASVQKAPGTPKQPKPSLSLDEEIANLTKLIGSSTNQREIVSLREQLDAKCAQRDKLEHTAIREGIQKSAQRNELALARGFLIGSAHACRIGV